MRTRHANRLVVLAVVAIAVLVGSALPASAAPFHDHDTGYTSGRIRFANGAFGLNFDTPGPSVGSCISSGSLSGTIDEAGGTDTADGTLAISVPFPYMGSNYILTVSGTSAATNRGDWSAGTTGTFGSLSFPGTIFNIKAINSVTCAPGSQVCGSSSNPAVASGTFNLTMSGGTYNGATLSLGTGEQLFVNATGVLTNAGCTFFHPLNLLIATGGTVTFGDNPTDDVPPFGTDPGAIFTQ